jgi:predicted DNA-binding antitoxin AbrB/MazE fold protein
MSTTFTAIYEQGILRPLLPLALPEHARVEVRIVPQSVRTKKAPADRQDVYDALMDAGLVKTQTLADLMAPISEADLAAAADALATVGPISELIIAERAESY